MRNEDGEWSAPAGHFEQGCEAIDAAREQTHDSHARHVGLAINCRDPSICCQETKPNVDGPKEFD